MQLKYYAFVFSLCFTCAAKQAGNAQVIYTSNLTQQVVQVDLSACTTAVVTSASVFNDMAVGPPGIYYTVLGSTIYSVNSATGTSTAIAVVPGIVTGLEFGPNGLIYALGLSLFSINPATGVVVNIGPLPSGWLCVGDIVYLDGSYYATMQGGGGPDFLVKLNMTNPLLSTVISNNLPGQNLVAGAGVFNVNCPKMYWLDYVTGGSIIWEYDLNTQNWTQVCPGLTLIAGGAGTFPGYSFPYSCSACVTSAGSLQSASLNFCATDPAIVPYNNNAILDANDLLQYILFSDPGNPAGSILAVSNTATIPYSAAYAFGQTYYLATVAGNNVGGNVDLNDPCLDFSNFVPVVWRPKPAVTFSGPNAPVCTGECQTIDINFVGTPPFSLNATATYAGVLFDNIVQNFNGNNVSIVLCAPLSPPDGAVVLQALSVSDVFCVCMN